MRSLSMQDPLTQLRNRRQFDLDLQRVWSDMPDQPASLLIADIDFFKRFNDTHGHPAGDVCLKQVATVLDRLAKQCGGYAVRLGGEEFGLLLPGKDLAAACRHGRRLCDDVRALRVAHGASDAVSCVTVSVGVSCVLPEASNSAALFKAADDALYAAKAQGRDRMFGDADHPQEEMVPLGDAAA